MAIKLTLNRTEKNQLCHKVTKSFLNPPAGQRIFSPLKTLRYDPQP